MKATAEITMLHLQAELFTEVIGLPKIQGNKQSTLDSALRGQRSVFLTKQKDWVACNVYDRNRLPIGFSIPGPALIEEPTTTTFVPSDQRFARDETGQLIIWSSVISHISGDSATRLK
jgi:N-methylhydantoinase A